MVKRILVIDDFADIRKLFVRALEDSPFKVDTAPSGAGGIKMQRKNKYSLIFLDLNMPGLNGIKVLRKIRSTDKDVPIYIMTAFYQDFFSDLTAASDDGLKFEVTLKPLTIKQISLIAKETLEEANVIL